MTLREVLSQPTYPEGQYANGWYFCSDGRIYGVTYKSKEKIAHPWQEKEGYYMLPYPAQYQSSKFFEMREQLIVQYFQTFQELENAVVRDYSLSADAGWEPNMNPFANDE